MKYLANKLPLLLLVLMFICLSVSDSFAQIDEEPKAYKDYLEKYYRSATPKEMWRDYIDLRLRQDGNLDYLVERSYTFKEPFQSWAIEEALRQGGLSAHSVGHLLSGNYSKEVKERALKSYLNFVSPLSPSPLPSLINSHLERIMNLIPYISQGEGTLYGNFLIAQILRDPDSFYIVNSTLAGIIYMGSLEQRTEIAQRILNNNPGELELAILATAKIDTYSDLAGQMLLQQTESYSIQDGYDSAARTFLSEKMDRPN